MSDNEFQAKLRSVFDIADVDGSGAVSTSEMASMTASTGLTFTSQQLAAMMSEADTNGNGDMDFAEFTKVIKTRLKGASSDGVGSILDQAWGAFSNLGDFVTARNQVRSIVKGPSDTPAGSIAAATPVTSADSPLVIGIVGTGDMASSNAELWASLGLSVIIGSRDLDRGESLARRVGNGCVGTSVAHMCTGANVIILCIHPLAPLDEFIDAHRSRLYGKGKIFIDLCAAYTRYYSDDQRPNGGSAPYSTTPYAKARLGDASASWCKCLANLDASSLRYRRLQPVEVAGDDLAKSVMIRLLTMVGFEPLDCGGIDDCAKIEPGYHSRRWKHPKHLAYHGQNHP